MPSKMTKEYFISKGTEMYNNRYIYHDDFVDRKNKMTITCPIHGDFQQSPAQHLTGKGCPLCGRDKETERRKSNFEEFTNKAREIHDDKYIYNKFIYDGAKKKGIITCPIHGDFLQTPDAHINKRAGCPHCKAELRKECLKMTQESFNEKAHELYDDRFDLSHVQFVDHKTPVEVVCKEHGPFMIPPHLFLRGQNCPECGKLAHGKTFQKTHEEFLDEAHEVHGYRYDYRFAFYEKCNKKIKILCHEVDPITGEEHGIFEQTPSAHLAGNGCPKCNGNLPLSDEEFSRRGCEVHHDRYIYVNAHYVNSHTPVEIICPKHGPFWQMPYKHLNEKHGCPHCAESKSEVEIHDGLTELGINFSTQKQFKELGLYKYDFFLEDYNILIECQGAQHFKHVSFFNKEVNEFEERVNTDIKKYKYAIKHGYKILYTLPLPQDDADIDYKQPIFHRIYNSKNTFKTPGDLLNYIKNLPKIL